MNNTNFLCTWELFSICAKKENFRQLNENVKAMEDLLIQNYKHSIFAFFASYFTWGKKQPSIQKDSVF